MIDLITFLIIVAILTFVIAMVLTLIFFGITMYVKLVLTIVSNLGRGHDEKISKDRTIQKCSKRG